MQSRFLRQLAYFNADGDFRMTKVLQMIVNVKNNHCFNHYHSTHTFVKLSSTVIVISEYSNNTQVTLHIDTLISVFKSDCVNLLDSYRHLQIQEGI